MATVALHFPRDPSRLERLPDADLLTGLVLDRVTGLGWDQGFDPAHRQDFSWQVNEVSWTPDACGTTCSVVTTLPSGRSIVAPFAGIASCAESVLARLGVTGPCAYSFAFAFAANETTVREPEPSQLFRRAPLGSPARSVVTLSSSLTSAPSDLSVVLGGYDDAVTDVAQPAPSLQSSVLPSSTLHHSAPPELPGTEWHTLGTVSCDLREWSPELAGAVANVVAHSVQQSGGEAAFALRLARVARAG